MKSRSFLMIAMSAVALLLLIFVARMIWMETEPHNEPHPDSNLQIQYIGLPGSGIEQGEGRGDIIEMIPPSVEGAEICSADTDKCVNSENANVHSGDMIVSPKLASLSVSHGAFNQTQHQLNGAMQIAHTMLFRTEENAETETFKAMIFKLRSGELSGNARIHYLVVQAGDRFCALRSGSYKISVAGKTVTFRNMEGISHCFAEGRQHVILDEPGQSHSWQIEGE